MRQAFIKTIEKLAIENKNLVLLTADLGYTVFENFKTQFPDRFYNLGVAETNMIGMAAGLALSGMIPITYSIATFASLRPYEFIRNDVCYHNANVKMVGVGGGLGYGSAGFTHCNFEDLAVLRPLPNLVILNPADPMEAEILTELAIKHQGPVYLRLGKVGEPMIHQTKPKLKIGRGIIFQTGQQVAILSTGAITANVLRAMALLSRQGIKPTLAIMHTIKPIDTRMILQLATSHRVMISVEEHSITGGLGSAAAEILSEAGSGIKFKRLGITKTDYSTSGSQEWLRDRCGLSPEKIAAAVQQILV